MPLLTSPLWSLQTQGGLEGLRFIWDQTSVVSISSSQGVIFDYSFKVGGVLAARDGQGGQHQSGVLPALLW